MVVPKYSKEAIVRRFDGAAENYDQNATVQSQIAHHLADIVIRKTPQPPAAILDIGCGTGFVAEAVIERWPRADLTAVDSSLAMLRQAKRKLPHLRAVAGDITAMEFGPEFDLILSSMALHWLAEPQAAIKRWQRWLKPGGRLFVAFLVAGSFAEWRDLCISQGVSDSLWPLPPADFAGVAAVIERRAIETVHSSARDFLHSLKAMGGATPKPGHKPIPVSAMRRLLRAAPKPFTASYNVLYLEMTLPSV